jgi:hypothetical protein
MITIELNNKEQEMLDKISKYLGQTDRDILKLSLNKFFEEFIGDCYFNNREEDFKNEIWKDIPEFEGYYQASTMGRIRSLDRKINKKVGKEIFETTRIGRIFRLRYKKNRRYLSVRLSKNGKIKGYPLHRLIAITFIENSENKPQVNHLNGIKSDNRVENLSWTNSSENIKHAITMGLNKSVVGENHGSCIFKNEDVIKIRELYATGNYSYNDIGKMFNSNKCRIFEIVKRKTWKHI